MMTKANRDLFTRLFGAKVGPSDSRMAALEMAKHVSITGVRDGDLDAAIHNLLMSCVINGLGRQPMGWSLTQRGDDLVLAVLCMKSEAKAA